MCPGLRGHLRSPRELLIAAEPLAGHRPSQRYLHRHLPVGRVKLDVCSGIDVCHLDPAFLHSAGRPLLRGHGSLSSYWGRWRSGPHSPSARSSAPSARPHDRRRPDLGLLPNPAAGQVEGLRALTPAGRAGQGAQAVTESSRVGDHMIAIGLIGDPVPRSSRSGAITQKNDQRPASSQSRTRSSNCR
jgi:hypothetical protein